jgi:hypothetical protein
MHILKRYVYLGMLLALVAAMGTGCATTQQQPQQEAMASETPDWFFHDIVDYEFVKQHVGLVRSGDVFIADARPYKTKYAMGYIPTSVSLPNTKFDENEDKLPENKDALIIFYCEGPT